MGNRQAKKTNQMIDTESSRINQDYGSLNQGWRERATGLGTRSDQNYQQLFNDWFGRMSGSTGLPGVAGAGSGGGSGHSGPGNGEYGWGRAEFERMRPFINSLGAPLSAADRARMGGGGVYDEAAKTGLISDEQAGDMRLRASRTGRSMWDALDSQRASALAASGGNAAGAGAMNRASAREAARSAADAALEAELGIADTRNQNRLAGAAGMAGTEGNIQELIKSRLLGAGGLQQALASGMLSADQAQALDARQRDQLDASTSAAMRGLDLQRELGFAGLLGDLYRSTPGELTQLNQDILSGMGGQTQGQGNALQLRASYNPNRDWLDRALQIGGVAAGAVAPFIGGGGKPGGYTGAGGTPFNFGSLGGGRGVGYRPGSSSAALGSFSIEG